ncbi:MAG: hypothetical protein ACXVLT_15815 [Flavisolibacter sp.]
MSEVPNGHELPLPEGAVGRGNMQERLAQIGKHPDIVYQMLLDLGMEKVGEVSEAQSDTIWGVAHAYGILAQDLFPPDAKFAFWNSVNTFYRGEPHFLTGRPVDPALIIDDFELTDEQRGILKQIADQTHVPYSGEQSRFDWSSIPHTEEVIRQRDAWNKYQIEHADERQKQYEQARKKEWQRASQTTARTQQNPPIRGK